ncbi:MAG: murein biosynthesis integral membrane protein MurJ [Actinomycetota bacterium]
MSRSIGRNTAVAALGTGLSRATGFLRLAAMAFAIGVAENRLADTYSLANSTTNIIFELILGGVLSSVLIRVYIEVRDRDGAEAGWAFISKVTNLSLIVLTAIALIGIFLAPLILKAYTWGSHSSDIELQRRVGTFLLRLFMPQIVFYAFAQISGAVLQAHRRFGMSAIAPVLNNLTVAGVFVAFALTIPVYLRSLERVSTSGLVLLGLGTTLGVALFSIVPFVYMRAVGWRWSASLGFADPDIRRLARLSGYLLGYVVINQIGLWVALLLAYRIQGGVAGYQTAFVFFQLPHGLLAVSIAAVMFTEMADKAVTNDMPGFTEHMNRALRAVAFVILPSIAGYLAIAPQVIGLLLEHGIAGSTSTALVSTVLLAWAPGILFFSMFYVVLRGFYALGDTKTPMLINAAALIVNVTVNVTLFQFLTTPNAKIAGLAVGHGASYLIASVIGLAIIRRRTGKLLLIGMPRTMVVTGLASAATWSAALFVVSLNWPQNLSGQILQVTVSALGGLLVFLVAARFFQSEELQWIRRSATRRI